jgi:hypothetical protein
MTHQPGHLGVVYRDDLFRSDPDNPNNPNRLAVKNASKVINPDLVKNVFSNMTSMVPSKPTPIRVNFDATGKTYLRPTKSWFKYPTRIRNRVWSKRFIK